MRKTFAATAAYRVRGLRDNRPLIITQADATRSVLQRMLVVTFQFFASPLAQALKTAVVEADAFGKSLRHLVLAVAAPVSFNSENACASATAYPLNTATDAALSVPNDPLTVHAPIRLVFRTMPTKR